MATLIQRRWPGLAASKITGSVWSSFPRDLPSATGALFQIVDHPDFRAALSWSNPDLWQKLERGEVNVQSSLSLRRYALRFAFRATPSGLFGWTDHSEDSDAKGVVDVSLSSLASIDRHEAEYDIEHVVQVNPTLYRVDSEYRLYHRRPLPPFSEEISAVEWTPFIEEIINHLSFSRGATEGAIVEFVKEQAGCDCAQAIEFVQGLCDSGLLLRPRPSSLTEQPLLEKSAGAQSRDFRRIPIAGKRWPEISTDDVNAQGRAAIEPNRDHWYVNAKIMQSPSPIPQGTLAAINGFLGVVGTLGDPLADFKRAFDKRYGGRWVPLMIALDPEVGLDFKDPLSSRQDFNTGPHPRRTKAVSRIAERIARSPKSARIDIDDVINDLESFGVDGFVSLVEKSDSLNPSYSLKKASSKGLLRPLMRNMSHGDARLETIQRHLEIATGPDGVAADVLSDFPPSLRDLAKHPPITRSVIVTSYQEELKDIRAVPANTLEVSVLRGTVVLRHAETQEAIAPVISTAISPKVADSVLFRFLSFIESQNNLTVTDDWLRWEVRASYLPSLVYGGIEVSPNQWLVKKVDFDDRSPDESIARIRELPNFPRFVQFGRGDRQISLDTECSLSFEVLLKELAKQGEIWLTKCAHQAPFAGGPEIGEYAVCKLGSLHTSPAESRRDLSLENGVDWLYFKLFCSEKALTSLLPSIARNLTDLAREAAPAVLQWHYLFYPHDGNHMRLRWRVPAWCHASLRRRLHQLVHTATGLPIANVEEHHYQPEHTRYGKDLGLIHEFWTVDSARCLHLLERQESPDQQLARVALAIANVANDVGMNLAEFSEAMASGRTTYRREFALPSDRTFLRAKMDSFKRTASLGEVLLCRVRDMRIIETANFPGLKGFFHDLAHLSVARIHPIDFRRMEWVAYELWMKVLTRKDF